MANTSVTLFSRPVATDTLTGQSGTVNAGLFTVVTDTTASIVSPALLGETSNFSVITDLDHTEPLSLPQLTSSLGSLTAISDVLGPWPDPVTNPSAFINTMTFDAATYQTFSLGGTDNWPMTWADDGHQYTSGGDGAGWDGGQTSPSGNITFSQVSGGKTSYTGTDVFYSDNGAFPTEGSSLPPHGKTYGIISIAGVLYSWVSPWSNGELESGGSIIGGSYAYSKLWKSTDHGVTWTDLGIKMDGIDAFGVGNHGFFNPTMVQFGQDYAGAPDNFVYMHAIELKIRGFNLQVQSPGEITLMRVLKTQIEVEASYEWFIGVNGAGTPFWSSDRTLRVPCFEDSSVGWTISVSYNEDLGRYLLMTEHTATVNANLGVFDAPDPWGPWTSVFQGTFPSPGGGEEFYWNFSNKWTKEVAGGKRFVMVYTGINTEDSFNSIEGDFTTPDTFLADFLARSTAAGVFFDENFSSYANTTELLAGAAQAVGNTTLDNVHGLSGKGARITTEVTDTQLSGSWNHFMNGTDDTPIKDFYYQMVVYCDEHFLNYPFSSTSSTWTSPKLFVIDGWNVSSNEGELVCQNQKNYGLVNFYGGKQGSFSEGLFDFNVDISSISGTPFSVPGTGTLDPGASLQPLIDRGTPAAPFTQATYGQRFGGLQDHNLPNDSDVLSGVLLDAQGLPDADMAIGAMMWEKNGYTVIEVQVNSTTGNAKGWAAKYGEAPIQIFDAASLGHTDWGNEGHQYNGVQLTTFMTDNPGNESNRQETYVSYTELVGSVNPINFPGGFSLPVSGLPSWRTGMTDKTWQAIGTTIDSVNPCPPGNCVYSGATGHVSVCVAWGGAVATTRKLCHAFNGGHNDYGGTECYEIDFFSETPTYVLQIPPSTNIQQAVEYNADGTPASRHVNDHVCYIPTGITNGNRLFTPGAFAVWDATGSAGSNKAASYVIGSTAYDPIDTFPDIPFTAGIDFVATVAWDSAQELVWLKMGNDSVAAGVYSFDPATKTWVHFSSNWAIAQPLEICSAIDPGRRIFLHYDGGSNLFAVDLDDPAASPVIISATGSGPSGAGPGLIFHTATDAFLSWRGGSTVYKLTPGADWRVDTWAWTTVVNGVGGDTPGAVPAKGVFGRFGYLSDLEVFVAVTTTTAQPQAYAIPPGGL